MADDTTTLKMDNKTVADLVAGLKQFNENVDRLRVQAEINDAEYERREARMVAVGRHTDEMIAVLKRKLATP